MTTAEINWDAPPPRRPKMPGLAPLPAYAVTITITCRVCGLRSNVEVSAPAKLCRECAHDLEGTRARVEAGQRAADDKLEAAHVAWQLYLAGLAPDVEARWHAAWELRTRAETLLAQAMRAKGRADTTPEQQLARIESARAELDTINARFAKTKLNPANPIAAVLAEEDRYRDAVAQAREEQQRWALALQEVETAEEGGVPF